LYFRFILGLTCATIFCSIENSKFNGKIILVTKNEATEAKFKRGQWLDICFECIKQVSFRGLNLGNKINIIKEIINLFMTVNKYK
jgi:hypothetical protein